MSTDGLTARGEARRDEILGVVLSVQRARLRRRRAMRAGVAAAALLVAAGAAYLAAAGGGAPATDRRIAEGPAAPTLAARAYIVETDPSIVERVSVVARSAAAVIDDDELTRLLREAGREEGIVRVGGRVMLESEVMKRGDDGA